jgi:hypothetical protein
MKTEKKGDEQKAAFSPPQVRALKCENRKSKAALHYFCTDR